MDPAEKEIFGYIAFSDTPSPHAHPPSSPPPLPPDLTLNDPYIPNHLPDSPIIAFKVDARRRQTFKQILSGMKDMTIGELCLVPLLLTVV